MVEGAYHAFYSMRRIVLPLLLVIGLGAIAAFLLGTSGSDVVHEFARPESDSAQSTADAAAPEIATDSAMDTEEPQREVAKATIERVKTIEQIVADAPTTAVRVRVEDQDGQPLAGATVKLRSDGSDRTYGLLAGFEKSAKSNADGVVSFDVKPIGTYRAVVEKAGFARSDLAPLYPGDDVLVTVNPGAGIEIVVTDETTGRPVLGATALLEARGPTSRAESDAQGRAEFVDLAADLYSLEVLALGYDRVRLEGIQIEKSARQVLPLEIRLPAGVPIEGVVRSQKGATPLPGATVRLLIERTIDGERLPILESVTKTDFAGNYRIDGAPRGTGNLLVSAEDHADERAQVRDPDEQDEIKIDVEMRLAAIAVGRVRTADGEPVVGATVRVRRDDGPSGAMMGATTDAAGEFKIENVRPDREMDLFVRGPDSSLAPGVMDDVVVPASGLPAPLEIVLEPASRLVGRVITSDGTPAPFARVMMSDVSGNVWRALESAPIAFADGDGAFRMVGLPAKTVTVRAEWEGFRSSPQEVVLPIDAEASCELVLDKSAGIRGVVLDGFGKPIEGARVSLTAQSKQFDSTLSFPKPAPRANTNNGGGGGGRNGGGGGGGGGRNNSSPTSSAPTSSLPTVQVGNRTIDLADWQRRNEDSRWGLIGRAAVSRDRMTSTRGVATSDANGIFEVRGLDPAEKHVLSVRHPDHESYFRMDVAADGATYTIELVPLITLRGRVVDGRTFRPVEEFFVEARPFDATPPQIRSVNDILDIRRQKSAGFQSLDGTFALRGMQPGYWDVTVRAEGYKEPVAQRLHLVRGQRPEILIEMIPAAWIRGKVLARDGSPVRRVPVLLRVQPPPGKDGKPAKPSRADMKRTETNNRGEYSFQNVEPKTYVLSLGPINKPLTDPVAIEIDDGEVKEHDFDVGQVGDLELEVEGRGGFGVPGASVSIQGSSNRVRLRARTDGVGQLVFPNLLPDDYRVVVDAGGYERLSESVTVKPDGDTDETLHLSSR